MRDTWLKYKFTPILSFIFLLVLSASVYRIFIKYDFAVFVPTECVSESCFIYEEEEYAFISKKTSDIKSCVDEDCLLDESCLQDGSCSYIDCEDTSLTAYFSVYSCK